MTNYNIRKQFETKMKQQCVLYRKGYGFSDDYCLWLESQLINAENTIKYLRDSAIENVPDRPIIDNNM